MIYTITGIDFKGDYDLTTHCFGYYLTHEEAVKAVLKNRCDLHETWYTYLVIERIPSGIHQTSNFETWFKYDTLNCKWVNCLKPDSLRKYMGFSMG